MGTLKNQNWINWILKRMAENCSKEQILKKIIDAHPQVLQEKLNALYTLAEKQRPQVDGTLSPEEFARRVRMFNECADASIKGEDLRNVNEDGRDETSGALLFDQWGNRINPEGESDAQEQEQDNET